MVSGFAITVLIIIMYFLFERLYNMKKKYNSTFKIKEDSKGE